VTALKESLCGLQYTIIEIFGTQRTIGIRSSSPDVYKDVGPEVGYGSSFP
jgi:hypothetical protein